MFRVILLSSTVGLAFGCTPATPLMADAPELDRLARRAVGGSVQLQLLDVSDQRTCGRSLELNELCVSGLRSALDTGLRSLLRQFVDPRQPGEKYAGSFQVLEFTQKPVFIGDGDFKQPDIVMRWRFELKNAAGDRILLLQDSSDEAYTDVREARTALKVVLEETLERIGEGLNDAEWKTSKPRPIEKRPLPESTPPPPTDPSPPRDAGASSAPGTAQAAAPDSE